MSDQPAGGGGGGEGGEGRGQGIEGGEAEGEGRAFVARKESLLVPDTAAVCGSGDVGGGDCSSEGQFLCCCMRSV